jgi:hypothetical protein
VSYVFDLSVKARTSLFGLPFDLQEFAFDVIDRIAENPALLVMRGRDPISVYDETSEVSGEIHYIFITAARDDINRMLRVESIGHVVRRPRPRP